MKWIIGLVALALIGAIGIHNGRMDSSALRAQTILQDRAEGRLRAVEADWATVNVRGQRAYLSGDAPDELSLGIARGAVLSSELRGGVLEGGVTRVTSTDVAIATPREGPYEWMAELSDVRVTLRGFAPTQRDRDSLAMLAESLYPGQQVDNRMAVQAGAPDDNWTDAARLGLASLSYLTAGEADLSDHVLIITGDASGAVVREAIRQGLEHLPAPYEGRTDLTLFPPPRTGGDMHPALTPLNEAPPPVEERDPPPQNLIDPPVEEPLADPQTPVEDPDIFVALDPIERNPDERPVTFALACQLRFDEALADSAFLFSSGSAAPAAESLPVFDAVAEIARDCSEFDLRIEGHTDATGGAQLNRVLSARRAQAVADHLVANGVPTDRLDAVGFGASRPLATNTTADGRRRNRRIELIVSQ